MFHPNPVTLEVVGKVESPKAGPSKIHFENASALLRYWPERGFAPTKGEEIPKVIMFRQNAVQRVRMKWWTLIDRGPADDDRDKQGIGHARIAELQFHGKRFTKEVVEGLYEPNCGDDDRKSPWQGYGKHESDAQQDQNLYEAFVARESIQLYARMGTITHHPDEAKDAKHPPKEGDYFAGLIIRLKYGEPHTHK